MQYSNALARARIGPLSNLTYQNGFIAGVILALLMYSEIIAIRMGVQFGQAILFMALVFEFIRMKQRRSVINTTTDGFISGFSWVYGFLNWFGISIF